MRNIEIDPADDGKQVHKWLRLLLPGMPLSGIHKFIRTGRIKVNGKRAKRDTVLHSGDAVTLYMSEDDFETTRKARKEKFSGVRSDVDVLYEDDRMMVVNKPQGVLVHAADGEEYSSTLQAQVEAYIYRNKELQIGQAFSPSPVHRLDRNTSGIVVFAKTSSAARELGNLFQSNEIKKTYFALVTGIVRKSGQVSAALSRENDAVTKVNAADGRYSLTKYNPIASAQGTTLLMIRIETGRTHQIRAHMRHLGHPLVNDIKYGAKRIAQETFFLHAAKLSIPPDIQLNAPLPRRFMAKLSNLEYDLERVKQYL